MTIHGRKRVGEDALDFLFDGEFDFVGELVAVAAEDLDAVVAPGIVRGGDDDAGAEAVLAGQEGDGWRSEDAGGGDLGATGAKAGGECGGDPGAALAGVHTHDHADGLAGLRQLCGQRQADCVDCALVQRRLTGDRANSIRAKQLPHSDPLCALISNSDASGGWGGGTPPPHPSICKVSGCHTYRKVCP